MLSTLLAVAALLTSGPADPTTYYLVPDTDQGAAVASCLTGYGWHGIQGDRMDAIYAPTAVIRTCGGEVTDPVTYV